jgi:hypothetical protein
VTESEQVVFRAGYMTAMEKVIRQMDELATRTMHAMHRELAADINGIARRLLWSERVSRFFYAAA